MSGDLSVQRQCQTCLATFSAPQELHAHLEAYRSQERTLATQIERCRAHMTLATELPETHDLDGASLTVCRSNYHGSHSRRICPYDGCNLAPFKTRQTLIRHFETHVPCFEVCVYCFDRLTTVSTFRKHAQTHRGANHRKNTFMSGISDDLHAQAILELDRLLDCKISSTLSNTTSAKKRALDTSELTTETSQPYKKTKSLKSMFMTSATTLENDCSAIRAGPLPPEPPKVPSFFDAVDFFAPPLFYDNTQVFTDNFDAPLFDAPPPMPNHEDQFQGGNSGYLSVSAMAPMSSDTRCLPEGSF
ncbi:hypothetical protein BDP55DRAFT_349117 [Colletotrichum godetiae]|uniref:C2H2-type domain-containing protein n=1 Tax=Colletotrichum godetiae TaxID=1209918 RepID=A0AAJ0EXY7_9PEZI|nr:uncharacterized protein BDP55DRAFT_349117 [Colletotrichum godetiae]KAK1690430.1 hypothetical protein BDP55DRAFT_349117 [Colletotrichum godetiae]